MENMKKMELLVKRSNAFLEKENKLLVSRNSESSLKAGVIHSDTFRNKLFLSDEYYNFATYEGSTRRIKFHCKQNNAYLKVLKDMKLKKERFAALKMKNEDLKHCEFFLNQVDTSTSARQSYAESNQLSDNTFRVKLSRYKKIIGTPTKFKNSTMLFEELEQSNYDKKHMVLASEFLNLLSEMLKVPSEAN